MDEKKEQPIEVTEIDYMLESIRAHMNLLIGELKAGFIVDSRIQFDRIKRDLGIIERLMVQVAEKQQQKSKKPETNE